MNITFLGHATVLVTSGNKKVIIDPFLTGNPQATVKPEDIKVDAVLLTHGHADHIGDAIEIAKRNDCVVIGSVELVGALLKHEPTLKIHPMGVGGSYHFEFGTVKLTKAFHGGAIEINNEVVGTCTPTGIVLTMDGKTFYHAGDTDVFGDMTLIGKLDNIDVCALPIGDNFTMGIDSSVIAAKLLDAGIYFPIHYNTFDLIKQDDTVWLNKMKENKANAVIVPVGGQLEV